MQGPRIKRLYYSMSEVSEIADVKPYLLRQWEGEFEVLKPAKSQSGRKLYKPADLDMVLRIKELYDQGYSNGAVHQAIDQQSGTSAETSDKIPHQLVREIRTSLEEILTILKEHDQPPYVRL